MLQTDRDKLNWLLVVGLGLLAIVFVTAQIIYTDTYWNSLQRLAQQKYSGPGIAVRPTPTKVKGLYLTAYSAGNPKKIQEITDLIGHTELNSVVIDLKDYSGFILYDSKLPFVNEHQLKDVRLKDVAGLVKELKAKHIYTIARLSAFQDPLLAVKKPEWALKSKYGGLWRDRKGLAWVDPTREEVWQYVASVAHEAARLGFDEINFDYIRFPTDGNLAAIVYTNGGQKRYDVIRKFFSYISRSLAREPVYLSADLFGLTTEKTGTDDMSIGQRLGDAVKYFDYVCPMVYPSHYPPGYMNFANPAEHPYEVVFQAITAGVRQADDHRAKIRAWIQAFDMGAIYDGAKIRAQISAAEKAGSDGWVMWNASNRYSADGLLPK